MKKQLQKLGKSVYKLTFDKGANIDEYPVKEKIALLFLKNRSKYYKSQEDIKDALAASGMPCSQSAVSKGMGFLAQFPFMYHNQVFAICDTPKGYCLLSQADYPKSLRYALQKKNLLERDAVFFEELPLPQMFIFWIVDSEKEKECAAELFIKCLHGNLLDLFYLENRLVILLDKNGPRFPECSKMLRNFFSKDNSLYLDMQDD